MSRSLISHDVAWGSPAAAAVSSRGEPACRSGTRLRSSPPSSSPSSSPSSDSGSTRSSRLRSAQPRSDLLTGLGPVDTVAAMTRGLRRGDDGCRPADRVGRADRRDAERDGRDHPPRRKPHARVRPRAASPTLSGCLSRTYLQTIFVDVMIVIAAPLARRIAPQARQGRHRHHGRHLRGVARGRNRAGRSGLRRGRARRACSDVPLGFMLLGGLAVAVPTVILAILIMSTVFRLGFWKPDRDEQVIVRDDDEVVTGAAGAHVRRTSGPDRTGPHRDGNRPHVDRRSASRPRPGHGTRSNASDRCCFCSLRCSSPSCSSPPRPC